MQSDDLTRAYIMLLNNFIMPGFELRHNDEGTPSVGLCGIDATTPPEEAVEAVEHASVAAQLRYERLVEEIRNPPQFNFNID